MGRPLFFIGITALGMIALLFFPFVLETDVFFDLNKKKLVFTLFLYKLFKIVGGYVETYKGGIAWHITSKRAILLPYSKLDSERKRFSFMKTFRLLSLRLTTETGAEYLLPIGLAHTALRALLLFKYKDMERIENNLWLTNGDILRVAIRSVIYCNVYMLLCAFLKFLKKKWSELWNKEMKKSIS